MRPEKPPVVTIHLPPRPVVLPPEMPVVLPAAMPAGAPEPTFSRHALTALITAFRDSVIHLPSKFAGLGMYALAAGAEAAGDVTAVAALATLAGGISAATMAGKIAMHQFGTDSVAGQAATALSAVAGGAVGMSLVSGDVVAAASAGSAALYAVLLLSVMRYVGHTRGEDISATAKACVALSAVGLAALGFYAGHHVLSGSSTVHFHLGAPADRQFLARQFGAVFESILVESFKAALTGVGPAVDSKGMPLEGRMMSLAPGAPIFTAAAIAFGAVLGSRTLPAQDGTGGAVIVGELAASVALNCVDKFFRGGVNVVSVMLLWTRLRRKGVPVNPYAHKPKAKTAAQRLATVLDRSAVRHGLILARNAIYGHLRVNGYSLRDAAIVSLSIYTVFAQYRDLFSDLMAGEGWTPEAAAGPGGAAAAAGGVAPGAGERPLESPYESKASQPDGEEQFFEYSSKSSTRNTLLEDLFAQGPEEPTVYLYERSTSTSSVFDPLDLDQTEIDPPDNPDGWREFSDELEASYQASLLAATSPSSTGSAESGSSETQPLLAPRGA